MTKIKVLKSKTLQGVGDCNLTYAARGILAYIVTSQPKTLEDVTKRCPDETEPVIRAIDELRQHGYTIIESHVLRICAEPMFRQAPLALEVEEPEPTVQENKSGVKEFINAWCVAFRKHFGQNYMVKWAVEGAAAKRLLANSGLTVHQLIDLAAQAWRAPQVNDKYFWCAKAGSLLTFASHLNEIQIELGRIQQTVKNRVNGWDVSRYIGPTADWRQ